MFGKILNRNDDNMESCIHLIIIQESFYRYYDAQRLFPSFEGKSKWHSELPYGTSIIFTFAIDSIDRDAINRFGKI